MGTSRQSASAVTSTRHLPGLELMVSVRQRRQGGRRAGFAGTLVSGVVGPNTTTVLIAGDDAVAKSELADAIAAGGLKVVDAGPLARARELEALGFLQINLAAGEKISWTGGFGVVA